MGLSCGARAFKFSLFIFNLVFLICGFVCLGIGIWLILDRYAVDNIATATAKVQGFEKDDDLRELATKPTAVRQIGYILLIGGIIVIFVAFLGCCGAFKYATCLMLILAVEIACGIYAAMHSHMFDKDFRQVLNASLKLYNGTDSQRARGEEDSVLVKTAWDKFMKEKSCCGVDSRVGEFRDSGWYQLTGRRYEFPPACCPPKRNGKLMPYCPTIQRYGEGCYVKIEESLKKLSSHFKVVMWTAIVVSLIQVSVVAFFRNFHGYQFRFRQGIVRFRFSALSSRFVSAIRYPAEIRTDAAARDDYAEIGPT
ncbi:Protein TSP-11 [Aphelenchoides avenae]|nr:Protein TSP-11 [Aphelenchus avenae]